MNSITLVLPDYILWLAAIALIFSSIDSILAIYKMRLERQIEKLKEGDK